MTRHRVVPLGLAILCITSLGVVGTALDSSLTTDPDDEINLNYDRLPIGTSDAAAVQEEIEGERDDETVADQPFQEMESMGTQVTPPTLLDRLLALLGEIVRLVLLFGAMVTLVALLYHYRERLLALFRTILTTDGETSGAVPAADGWPGTKPSNAVDRAWLWMVRRADPERPATKTPAECARSAREAGIDPSVVETVTDAFERVHYGGVPVEHEADRVRAVLEQIRSDGRRPGGGGQSQNQNHYRGDA